MSDIIRGRFAPSPSGRMHLGNIMSALLAWLDIRSKNGSMVFRLEDLDPERSWDNYARLLADDLIWLGLDWDEGWPDDASCAQSRRSGIYEAAFSKLEALALAYPCFCSRAQRLAASAPHQGEEKVGYACHCSAMSGDEISALINSGRMPALKITVPDMDITVIDGHYGKYIERFRSGRDDFIIRRADGVYAYQLAVSVDDAAMGITRVVRASDLLSSSPRQKWLIETLGGTAPEYCHAPLLTAPDGRKLSKREGDLNMEHLRLRFSPEELTGRLAELAGIIDRPEPLSARELIREFDWSTVPADSIVIPDQF